MPATARRKAASLGGLCGTCLTNVPRPGRKTCQRCHDQRTAWRNAHPAQTQARERAYNKAHRTSRNATNGRWLDAHPEQTRVLQRRGQKTYREKLRRELLLAYGGACVCCGEADAAFLNIDHIGGQVPEREYAGHKLQGHGLYQYLRRENWPPGYRVLCSNCNQAVRWGRICPHQRG